MNQLDIYDVHESEGGSVVVAEPSGVTAPPADGAIQPRRQSGRTILTNAASSWLMYISQLAAAFVISPIMVRGLGDVRYGIWSIVEATLAYLALFDLGVGASVVRHVSRFDEAKDQDSLNRTFSTSLLIFAVAGSLVLMISVGTALLWSTPFGMTGTSAMEARWLLALFGIRLSFGLPLSVYPAVLDGLSRYPAKSAIRTTFLLGGCLAFLAVLLNGGGIRALALTNVLTSLGEHVCMALAVRHYAPRLRFSWKFVDRGSFQQIRGYSVNAFIALLAGQISYKTDALVIGSFLDIRFVTYFGLAAKLVEYGKMSLYSGVTVLTPTISAMEARNDEDGIRRLLIRATRYVLLVMLPVQVGFVLLGKEFITIWMRDAAYGAACYPTLVILSLPFSLAVSQAISGRILYGTGRLVWFARMTMLEAGVNFVLSVLLVGRYGIEGVAWGTSVPSILFNLILAVYVCRMFAVPVRQYVVRSFLSPLLLAVVPALVWLGLKQTFPINNWGTLILVGLAGVACHALVALPTEFGFAKSIRLIQNGFKILVIRANDVATPTENA